MLLVLFASLCTGEMTKVDCTLALGNKGLESPRSSLISRVKLRFSTGRHLLNLALHEFH